MQKSITTILADTLRHVLILCSTAYIVYSLWKWHWILAVIAAIPVYLIMLNIFGFLTLPLYAFTSENRLGRKVIAALDSGETDKALELLYPDKREDSPDDSSDSE